MKDIKDYLEQTNTVLLTKEAFEWLKERASALDKVRAEIHATAELHEDGDYYLRDEWIDEIFDKYQAEVEKLQPVTPKPKMGRWEWVQYDYNPKIGNWHCSECRCIVVRCVSKEEEGGIPFYKYCPHCGARMEGGAND